MRLEVGLGEGDVLAGRCLGRRGHERLETSLAVADGGRTGSQVSGAIERATSEQLGQQLHEARAADPARRHVADGLVGEAPIGSRLDAGDGALCRAHPAGRPTALEGRSGRAGTADEEVAVADDRLAVGARVDEHGQLRALVHATRQHVRGDIATHVAAAARHAGDDRAGVDAQADVSGVEDEWRHRHGHIGLTPDLGRWQAQEQVHHGRVAGHGRGHDLMAVDVVGQGQAAHEHVDLVDDPGAEIGQAAGLAGMDDACDHVLAVGHLAVECCRHTDGLARPEVHQLDHDRGRADVHGQAVGRDDPRARPSGPAARGGNRRAPAPP